jgi:hypothetical protein
MRGETRSFAVRQPTERKGRRSLDTEPDFRAETMAARTKAADCKDRQSALRVRSVHRGGSIEKIGNVAGAKRRTLRYRFTRGGEAWIASPVIPAK